MVSEKVSLPLAATLSLSTWPLAVEAGEVWVPFSLAPLNSWGVKEEEEEVEEVEEEKPIPNM